jgi:hypothetical protein
VSTEAIKSVTAKRPKPRITFTHVLLGFAVLCLLLWSIKATQHAMQPKYQGKTAEEWFAGLDPFKRSSTQTAFSLSMEDPAFQAFTHLGPDAAQFLWQEYNHKDSKLETWTIRKIGDWSSGGWRIDSANIRNFKAMCLLQAMGPKAECLVPDLRNSLKSAASDYERSRLLEMLNKISPKDLAKLPYLIPGLNSTNAGVRAQSLDGLHCMGVQASSALPALEKLLQKTKGFEQLNIATVMVALGDQSKLKLLQAEIQNPNTQFQGLAFLCLASLTKDGVDVVPTLTVIANDPRSDAATKDSARLLIQQITMRADNTTEVHK